MFLFFLSVLATSTISLGHQKFLLIVPLCKLPRWSYLPSLWALIGWFEVFLILFRWRRVRKVHSSDWPVLSQASLDILGHTSSANVGRMFSKLRVVYRKERAGMTGASLKMYACIYCNNEVWRTLRIMKINVESFLVLILRFFSRYVPSIKAVLTVRMRQFTEMHR